MITSKIINPKSLLITAPHHLGDLVAKVPFIRLFKTHFPNCRLVLAARAYVHPLARLVKEIDEILNFEDLFSKSPQEVVETLKGLHLDAIVHILSVQNQIGPDVIGFAKEAKIPYRIGNICRSKWSLWKKNNFGLTHNLRQSRILPKVHEFEWNLAPLKFFNIAIEPAELNLSSLLKTAPLSRSPVIELKPDCFHLIIHPGSLGNAKEWPTSHFISLIQKLGERFQVILTGSKEERDRFDFNPVLDQVCDLRGKLELNDLIQLISQVDGLVAASTGPLHIASLFGIKTLGLFPKQENLGVEVWGARGDQGENFSSAWICSACKNKLSDLNKKLCRCMEGIDVELVVKKMKEWSLHESTV